jgi:hypothetical protein
VVRGCFWFLLRNSILDKKYNFRIGEKTQDIALPT